MTDFDTYPIREALRARVSGSFRFEHDRVPDIHGRTHEVLRTWWSLGTRSMTIETSMDLLRRLTTEQATAEIAVPIETFDIGGHKS